MIPVSFSVRLHLDVSSNRALSLPQSFVAAKRRQKPAPSSEGAEAAPPHSTELQRCKPRLSPPLAGCPHPSRCSAKAQHRATFPKGKAKAALESQTPQREPRFALSSPLWQYPIKMCRDPRHTSTRPKGALHAAKPRFMCRRHASYPEGVLHLQHARAVILSFPPAQSGSGDTGKADRAAVKIQPSTPPAEQSPCRKTEQARCNHRSQR